MFSSSTPFLTKIINFFGFTRDVDNIGDMCFKICSNCSQIVCDWFFFKMAWVNQEEHVFDLKFHLTFNFSKICMFVTLAQLLE